MAVEHSQDVVYDLSLPAAARGALALALFGVALAACPNLEDVSGKALLALVASVAAFVLSALGGAAWVFDAPSLSDARDRADVCFTIARLALLAIFGVYSLQWTWVSGMNLAAVLGGFAGSWLVWYDGPWGRWRWLARPGPGLEGYRVEGSASLEEPAVPVARAVQAPAEVSPGMEALLVSSGTFRVDRSRMIETLAKFQLARASEFLLPWIRLAVASGAPRLELDSKSWGLELRFAGRPLEPRLVADPYASLLDDEAGGDAARHKHLAYGLLAAIRLEPRAIHAWSGEGARRGRLAVEPKGAHALAEKEPAGLRTVIRVRLGRLQTAEAIAAAKRSFGLTDAELIVDGRKSTRFDDDFAGGLFFKDGPIRGAARNPRPGETALANRLYHLGALVESRQEGSYLRAVSNDDFTLSVSQNSVVSDRALTAAMELVQREAIPVKDGRAVPAPPASGLAFTKAGLFAALMAGVAASGAFLWAVESRSDLAWLAGAAYAVVTPAVLALLASWLRRRLAGGRNPFRRRR